MRKGNTGRTNFHVEEGTDDRLPTTPDRRDTALEDQVSPAGTFETVMSSEDDVDFPTNPPTKISIEHNVKTTTTPASDSSGVRRLIFGLSKPLVIMTVLFLLVSGGAGFLLSSLTGLNSQIRDLEAQVNNLNEEIDRLEIENNRYESLNSQLNLTVVDLALNAERYESLNGQLNLTVIDLNATSQLLENLVNDLEIENLQYSELNGELISIVSFLNDTALGLDSSLEFVSGYLADQISANKELVVQSLENTYRQRVLNWDCDYRDIFREESFGQDYSLAIANMDAVLGYLDQRVLSELCLSVQDFQRYLDREYPGEIINTLQLIRAVSLFTTSALDHYFPEPGESGLTANEWSEASYKCDLLVNPFHWEHT